MIQLELRKMINNLAIVQARMSSSRLPGKSNLKLKGMTVLNWVINTGKSIEGVDKVILATSKDKDCDCLEELANKENIFCIRGSEENVLSRYTDAIKKFNLDYVIRITGDDTCQDPDFISIALKQFFDQEFLIHQLLEPIHKEIKRSD
mgnify:CR=1 FL=1